MTLAVCGCPAVQVEVPSTQKTFDVGAAQFDGPLASVGPVAPAQPRRFAALALAPPERVQLRTLYAPFRPDSAYCWAPRRSLLVAAERRLRLVYPVMLATASAMTRRIPIAMTSAIPRSSPRRCAIDDLECSPVAALMSPNRAAGGSDHFIGRTRRAFEPMIE